MKKFFTQLALLFIVSFGYAQVGINTTSPNAQLDIKSSNQATPANNDGILIPKIDAFPVTNPTAAQNSMMVYLTTTSAGKPPGFYYWDNPSTSWKGIAQNSGWSLTGNSGTNPATNFIGTTDDNDVVFKRDNIVAGRLSKSQFAGSGNTSYGTGSLLTNSGASNTAIGSQALAVNTATGIGNSAVGERALASNTIGSSNNAFGWLSLTSNTSGSQNNAHGSETLLSNTTGEANSAFGYRSLNGNQIGSYNSAFGNASMLANKVANNNTAVGYRTLSSQTFNNGGVAFDTNNVAFGVDALKDNNPTSINNGINNTAVGSFSLTTNTTGSSNVAVGMNALHNSTTAYANTAIGLSSLFNNVSGSGNVAIGYQAGYNEAGSNKLYIENSNSATPLIYGEFDNDIVKINGVVKVHQNAANLEEMQIKNSNIYTHGTGNQNFGTGGDSFLVSSREGQYETAGIHGDGNAVTIWSAGDAQQGQNAALVYFLDEDYFDGTNTNPYNTNGTSTALRAYIDPSGAYLNVSDKNKKENIKKIENASEKIAQISGYTYQFKLAPSEIEKGDKPIKSSGVLAQEIEKVLPEAVQKNPNGDYFVNYAAITPLLIEAIKEQETKIKLLEDRLKAIEEKLSK